MTPPNGYIKRFLKYLRRTKESFMIYEGMEYDLVDKMQTSKPT